MLITVLLLIVLYLVRQHSLETRCFHCLLAVLSGLSIHTWLTFLLASGLIIFSVADWHERTVPFLRPVKFKSRYVNEFDFEYRNFLATGC